MSYTDFTWTNFSGKINSDRTITVKVDVTNTGKVAGKDVVQVYYKDPYHDGKVEKASANLIQFAKTDLLQPGEKQTVEITFEIKEMASFDWDNREGNGKFYRLDDGTYEITLRTDSHTTVDDCLYQYTIADDYVYDGSDEAHNFNAGFGKNATGIFSSATKSDELFDTAGDTNVIEYISRASGTLALPTANLNNTYSDEWVEKLHAYDGYTIEKAKEMHDKYDTAYVADDGIPSTWNQAAEGTKENTAIQLGDMTGVEYADPYIDANGKVVIGTDEGSKKWENFLNQLTFDELYKIVSTDHGNSAAMDRIGKPATSCNDGPSKFQTRTSGGITGTWWCSEPNIASTWNIELAYRQGLMMGNESLWIDVTGQWGFGLNTHRGPWGSREFEYYSEDGVLAGYIAAYVTKGCVDMGVVVYNKHIALNDQDSYRNTADGCATFVNEQAYRQIYLKPYEIAVKVGNCNGFMMSFMRTGAISADNNYNLMTKLCREEWGFKGDICTDAGGGDSGDACMLAGNDWPLMQYGSKISGTWDKDKKNIVVGESKAVSSTQYYSMRTSAQRSLYGWANSNAMNNHTDLTVFKGKTDLTGANGRALDKVSVAVDKAALGATYVSYELAGGALPAGVTLKDDGALSGTPTESGEFEFKAKVIVDRVYSATADFKITVSKLFKASALTGTVGDEDFETVISSDTVKLKADGGEYDSIVYACTNLPEGLSIESDGTIYGTPAKAGSYELAVRVTATVKGTLQESNGQVSESGGKTDTYNEKFTLVISEKAITPPPATTYKVTFDTREGSAVAAQDVAEGGKITAPAAPMREGYTFTGWYYDEACTLAADVKNAVTENITLYAGWTQIAVEESGCGSSLADGALVGALAMLLSFGAFIAVKSLRKEKSAK